MIYKLNLVVSQTLLIHVFLSQTPFLHVVVLLIELDPTKPGNPEFDGSKSSFLGPVGALPPPGLEGELFSEESKRLSKLLV